MTRGAHRRIAKRRHRSAVTAPVVRPRHRKRDDKSGEPHVNSPFRFVSPFHALPGAGPIPVREPVSVLFAPSWMRRLSMTHVRKHRSILAASEKRLLIYIAERLPRAINSDHLTSLGLAAMGLTGAAFAC